MCLDPVDVVRMNLRSTVSLTPLVESDAEIRERDSVRIQALGLGAQNADKLGREIQNLAEFTIALAKWLYDVFVSFFDLEVDPDPVEERTVVAPERLHATEAPAVVAVCVTNAKTHLTKTAGAETL